MTLDQAAEEFAADKNQQTANNYRYVARQYYLDGMIEVDEFDLIYDSTFPYLGREKSD